MEEWGATALERRPWFGLAVAVGGIGAAVLCYCAISPVLPPQRFSADVALSVLMLGAMVGFVRMLELFLPPVLLRLWPHLQGSRGGPPVGRGTSIE